MFRLGHIQIIPCFHSTRARIFTGEENATDRQSFHVVWQDESYVREGIAESRTPWETMGLPDARLATRYLGRILEQTELSNVLGDQ